VRSQAELGNEDYEDYSASAGAAPSPRAPLNSRRCIDGLNTVLRQDPDERFTLDETLALLRRAVQASGAGAEERRGA